MHKKKITILTGSGATINWGAPSTNDITKKITSDKTFTSITGKPLGKYIFDLLTAYYHKEPELVNFETILNALEYLHTFFFSKYNHSINKYKSSIPVFFNVKDDIFYDLLDFGRIYKKTKNEYRPHINGRFEIIHWDDFDSFFLQVYKHFINLISESIKKYSKDAELNKFDQLNNDFRRYLNYYKDQDFAIRFYTLNYDRIPAIISESNFFEGFTNNQFDPTRVITNLDMDCYYNLHGSLHYEIESFYNKISFSKEPVDFNSFGTLRKDMAGNSIPNNQFIAGLNKSSQVLTYPYNLFFNSLMHDLKNSDEIHFIGYSFNDKHINSLLDTQIDVNKIFIIDYFSYLKDFNVSSVPFKNRSWNKLFGVNYAPYESLRQVNDFEKSIVFFKGFKYFLENKQYSADYKEEEKFW